MNLHLFLIKIMDIYKIVDKGTGITRILSEEEFKEMKIIIECFRLCYEIEASYEILLDSYVDFSQALSEQTLQAVMERGFSNLEISSTRVSNKFNRFFANLLSAFSAYEDHCKKSTICVDRMESRNNPRMKDVFTKEFKAQSDSVFAFRCCEFLRDHVLHQSKAIKGYLLSHKRNEGGEETFSCSPIVPTKQFFSNRANDNRIALEIQSQGDTLNIRQITTECIDACSVIHAALRTEMQQSMELWHQRRVEILKNHNLTSEGQKAYVVQEKDVSGNVTEIPLVDLRSRIKYMESNNAAPLYLSETIFL